MDTKSNCARHEVRGSGRAEITGNMIGIVLKGLDSALAEQH